jgi:protein-S-isoprenylcysteine O-methyltransferase
MRAFSVQIMGAVFGLSEVLLALAKRSKDGSVSKDRGSLWMLWAVILASIALANALAILEPQAASLALHRAHYLGAALFIAGLALRWYAIIHLGRYFTVNVSIAAGQAVVQSGPYRLIRHPSYSGALLAFLGFGICSENWLSLVVLVVPVTLAFLRRIAIEEAALVEALGADYRAYAVRTKRLLPWVF